MMPGQTQPALLFMPDISGFTQFVSETEVMHSQHIVQELLEILIDSNHLNLQVSEIEGDAIFFYKPGDKPDLKSLLQQVEKMFTRFHAHLKLYEHQRICPCGACKNAVDLSLKIIVHFGDVTGISIKEHKKLFGKDVILLHRLLKNSLNRREYVLFTEGLVNELEHHHLPNWYMPQQASEQYDVGEVRFYFSDLSDLHKTVRVDLPVYNSSSKTYVAFAEEEVIAAPMEKIFETLITMQRRQKVAGGEKDNDAIIKIGEQHPCLITRNNNMNVTESVKLEPENIEMVEMNKSGIAGYRYILKKISPEETNLSVQMLIKKNTLYKFVFSIAIKSKMMVRIRQFLANLRASIKTMNTGISV
ncbi:MAG TPA: DUF2652 domain-containing protein [Chitinophagaceae bacterium]|jgi:hypothetical protein|nr:DUF2652 domain-containing protein [Chitinophagaceae bacterium]